MHVIPIALPVLALVSSALASCGHGVHFLLPRSEKSSDAREFTPPKWSYGTTTGPLWWHTLDPAWGVCANGTNQSPVLISTSDHPTGSVKVDLPTQRNVEFENLLTTVEVFAKGTLWADGITWNLAQFHFHTPSEHRLDLYHYDAEVHFVFTAADGSPKISVLGFFIDVDGWESTPFLETVFAHLDEIEEAGSSTHISVLDFATFRKIVNDANYYRYSGSLTTPPCTQGVNWYVANTALKLSAKKFLKLKAITKTNSRYTQNTPGQDNLLQLAVSSLCHS